MKTCVYMNKSLFYTPAINIILWVIYASMNFKKKKKKKKNDRAGGKIQTTSEAHDERYGKSGV